MWNKSLTRCSPGTKIEPDDQFLFYSSHRLPRYPVLFSKLLQKEMQKVAEARFNESEAICPGLNQPQSGLADEVGAATNLPAWP
jgi:hypothetical protein